MRTLLIFVSFVCNLCVASEEHSRVNRAHWPWQTTMPSLSTGKDGHSLHGTAARMDHALPGQPGLTDDQGDTPVILQPPEAEGLARDPVKDFQSSVRELKESIVETEDLLATAIRLCKEKHIENCDQSRHILEVRGKMYRLMVAMKRLTELKPMAFEIRSLKRNATLWVSNSTTKLNAARIALSSVMLTREAVHAKLDSLEKVESQWKLSMKQVSEILLKSQQEKDGAAKRASKAENQRLDFLSKLEAILQGVDVGDKSAEVRYEKAEQKLQDAMENEAKAKKRIFEAERLVDNAYDTQADSSEGAADIDIEKLVKPEERIVKRSEDEDHQKGVDKFGSGSTAEHPLPLVPQTLLAHSNRHKRVTPHHRHHRRHRGAHATTPGVAKLQRQAMTLQEQLADLEAPLPDEELQQEEPQQAMFSLPRDMQ